MPVPAGIAGASALFGGAQEASSAMGGVPSSQSPAPTPQFAGGPVTFDPNELIKQMTQPVDPSFYKAAATPVATGHTFNQPIMSPIPSFRPAPMNTQRVVGAGNARARGIGNALTGIMNAVGEFTTAEAQEKQKGITMNVQRLAQAQQNIDQARETLKTDPNNADAQRLLDQNMTIRNDVLSDKATRNVISKGTKISFTDPSQNKTDEHGQMQKALASYGEQFEKQLPQQLGPNVQAQAALKAAEERQKQMVDAAKEAVKLTQAQYQYSGRVDAAMIAGNKALAVEQQRVKGELKLESQRAADSMAAERYRRETELMLQRARDAAQNKTNAIDAFKLFNDLTDKYTERKASLTKDMSALTMQINTLVAKGGDQGRIQELRGDQAQLQRLIDTTNRKFDVDKRVLATSMDIDPKKLDEYATPPDIPRVGEGELSPDATKPTGDGRSTEGRTNTFLSTNPYTGKSYDRSVPLTDRAIIGGIYGGREALQSVIGFGQSLEGEDNPISRGARAVEDFIPSTYGRIKRETGADSDEQRKSD